MLSMTRLKKSQPIIPHVWLFFSCYSIGPIAGYLMISGHLQRMHSIFALLCGNQAQQHSADLGFLRFPSRVNLSMIGQGDVFFMLCSLSVAAFCCFVVLCLISLPDLTAYQATGHVLKDLAIATSAAKIRRLPGPSSTHSMSVGGPRRVV